MSTINVVHCKETSGVVKQ